MASKWSDIAGSNLAVPGPMVQLSDGTLVFIDASEPSSGAATYYLKYYTHSGVPTTIATIGSAMTDAPADTVALCVDSSDDLFVFYVEVEGTSTLYVQAFAKGSGYSWTAQTAQSLGSYDECQVTAAVWCNTGGGTGAKGHLLWGQAVYSSEWYPNIGTVDAGALLAGSTTSPSLANIGAGYYQPIVVSDGLGACAGAFAMPSQYGSTISLGTWTISSTGSVSPIGSGTEIVGATQAVAIARYAPGTYGLFYFTGSLTVTAFNASTVGSAASCPNPGTWPNSPTFGVFVDPTMANQIWAIEPAISASGGNVTIYRVAVTFSGLSATWSTSVVLDDTVSAYANADQFACVVNPTITEIDYALAVQTSSSAYAVLGDYAVLAQTPSSTLVSPSNGAYVDPTSLALGWTYNDIDGSTQAYWALRYKISGATSYSFWNATTGAGQSTICWNAGGLSSLAVPSGLFTDGQTVNWSAAVESSFGLQGAFPADATFVCQQAPTVTLTGPTGTQATSQPTATYTTTKAGGTNIISYRIMVYPASVATGGFTPGLTPGAAWDTGVVTGASPSGGVQISTPLTNETSFVVCMAVWETGNEQSAWAIGSPFLVAYDVPPSPVFSAANETGTGTVPAIVLTVTEPLWGAQSSSSFGGLIGGALMGGLIVGGGSSSSEPTDTGYTVTITYTDANGSGTVRYGDAVPLTPGTPVVVYDYEATPGVTRTYTATVTAVAGGVVVTATPVSASATLSISSWWLIEPLTPANSIPINVTNGQLLQHEAITAHYVLSPPGTITPPVVVSSGINGQDGQITVQTQNPTQWAQLLGSVRSGTVKWLMSPLGDGTYARLSVANPVSGQSGAAHQTTLTPGGTPATSIRNSVLNYVEVGQP